MQRAYCNTCRFACGMRRRCERFPLSPAFECKLAVSVPASEQDPLALFYSGVPFHSSSAAGRLPRSMRLHHALLRRARMRPRAQRQKHTCVRACVRAGTHTEKPPSLTRLHAGRPERIQCVRARTEANCARRHTRARAHATVQLLLTCFQPCESDETAGSAHAEDFEILHNSADGQAPPLRSLSLSLSAPSPSPSRLPLASPPAASTCTRLQTLPQSAPGPRPTQSPACTAAAHAGYSIA